jgi:hypothetical protein
MSKYNSQATAKNQKVRLVLLIERGIKRALITQSQKIGCKSRPESGSMNEIACDFIYDGLRNKKVNVDAIIKSGI